MLTIHQAVEQGRTASVRDHIASDASCINLCNDSGDQSLHLAAWQGRASIAELLLNAGAEIDARGHHDMTPLHYAVAHQSRKVLTLLLKRGAKTDVTDAFDTTPLYLAVSVEDDRAANELLKYQVSVDLRSALYLDGPESVIKRFSTDRSSVKLGDLAWDAIRVGSIDLITVLFDSGLDANSSDRSGVPLLLRAIDECQVQIVQILLHRGAGVDITDHVGTPLLAHCTEYQITDEIVALLKEYGAS